MLGGCAWTAQQVRVSPQVTIAASSIGGGAEIGLKVQDARASQTLGTKVPAGGGQITTSNSVATAVEDGLAQGLRRQGFTVASAAAKTGIRDLSVEIRAVDYKTAQGFWAGTVTVDVALEGVCELDRVPRVEKIFRGHREDAIQVAQSDYWVQQYVDGALSEAMNSLLGDAELMRCLAN